MSIFLLPLLAFVLGTLLIGALAKAFWPTEAVSVERRLQDLTGAPARPSMFHRGQGEAFVSALKRLGSAAPQHAAEMGRLRQRLIVAGFRSREALVTFHGIRIGLGLVVFAIFASPLAGRPNLFMALGACALAYVMAGMVLARLAKRRQHRIQLGLADIIDLLVVSVEAGLGLDQALQRVGEELAFAHPDLSDELRLVTLELRAGTARVDALRNLATRTGLDDISSLVTMLVQTDKFGTSVAQSLRVHSETLRTKRRQRAEEAAAKTGAKMVFPLATCVLPSIWVVTLGPAVIKFMKVVLPMVPK